MSEKRRIAVVGAGLAGLTCARALQFAGHDVVVFDKARGPGGRMATRRSDHGQFDHGAQFFTARDSAFAAEVEAWQEAGVVAPWQPQLREADAEDTVRFVGTPRMSALTRHLAAGLDVRYSARIWSVTRNHGWRLVDIDGESRGIFDALIVAVPAPQAVELVKTIAPDAAEMIAEEVHMMPCWAVMASFQQPLDLSFDAAWLDDSPLDWIAHDASKPGREPADRWVLHGSATWSEEHLEDPPEAVVDQLLNALGGVVGRLPPLVAAKAHRWRYARVSTPLGASASWNEETGIGLCGDWFIGPRVEAAWLSGRALAAMI